MTPEQREDIKVSSKAWAQCAMSWVPRSDGPLNAGTSLNFPRICSVKLALNMHSIQRKVSHHRYLMAMNFSSSLPWNTKEKRSGPHFSLPPTLTFSSHFFAVSYSKRQRNWTPATTPLCGHMLPNIYYKNNAWQIGSTCIFMCLSGRCKVTCKAREQLSQGWVDYRNNTDSCWQLS